MTWQRLSRIELRRLLEVSDEFLDVLEREAIARPDLEGGYPRATVERIRICWNLHEELGVNLAGLEVALHLLDRIRAERAQFRQVLDWIREQGAGGAR